MSDDNICRPAPIQCIYLNVHLRWKADVQVKVIPVRYRPKADVQLMIILLILESTQKAKDANSVRIVLCVDFAQDDHKEYEADTGDRSSCKHSAYCK